MNLDAARKRALILESDLNRLLITAELRQLRSRKVWTADLVRVAGRAKYVLTFAAPLARLLMRDKDGKGRASRRRRVGEALKLAAPLGFLWRRFRPKTTEPAT